MNSITPEEANQSLQDVNNVIATTRTAAAYAGSDLIMGLWGAAWTFGFVMSYVLQNLQLCMWIGPLWWVTVGTAGASMGLIMKRYQAPVQNSEGKRIGFLWFSAYAYAGVFCSLSWRILDWKLLDSVYGTKYITAMNCLIPMFIYVVMGLWLHERYFILFAVWMTVITLIGFLAFTGIFWLWMAVLGGGSFLAAAVYMRHCWRAAVRREQKGGVNLG